MLFPERFFSAQNPFKLCDQSKPVIKAAFRSASKSTRLAVVRHPLSRLFSGFKYLYLEKKISSLRNFLRNVTKLHDSGVPILESYVRYLLKTDDTHWWTYEKSCFPCQLDYSAIVKTDEMIEMRQFFAESSVFDIHIKKLFSASNSTVKNQSRKPTNLKKVNWKDYFSGLTPETWMRMLQHYRNDFIYFDYYLYYCQ